MKGTDCTSAQLASADQFIADRGWPDDGKRRESARADIVRLVAWYGALRYTAARDGGGGTLETPGTVGAVARTAG